MTLGGIAYAAGMMLLYIFAFGSYEGPRIVCYERYMGAYILGFFALIVMIFVNKWWTTNSKMLSVKVAVVVMCVVWIVLIPTKRLKYLVPVFTENSSAQDLRNDEEMIKSSTEESARIYLISQKPLLRSGTQTIHNLHPPARTTSTPPESKPPTVCR